MNRKGTIHKACIYNKFYNSIYRKKGYFVQNITISSCTHQFLIGMKVQLVQNSLNSHESLLLKKEHLHGSQSINIHPDK